MLEFVNGVSGAFTTVRATPLYWRVHVFGDLGSAESIGENELQRYRSNAKPERIALAPVDSLRLELEAFADAIEGRAPYPVTTDSVLRTVATFEAVIRALDSAATVTLKN
jgi:predicted dehydrogenase